MSGEVLSSEVFFLAPWHNITLDLINVSMSNQPQCLNSNSHFKLKFIINFQWIFCQIWFDIEHFIAFFFPNLSEVQKFIVMKNHNWLIMHLWSSCWIINLNLILPWTFLSGSSKLFVLQFTYRQTPCAPGHKYDELI
jgi:hypothetical protein